jgi:uroporphyrinogen-III synthase/uroporphyrinogen III methyltransferase/synthase
MNDAEKISLPLAGKRVLITRAAHQASKLSEGLRALGAEAVEVPVIEIRAPEDFAPLDRALRELQSYDWLILTSANTVRALADRAAMLGLRLSSATRLNVSAVGDATADAARQAGFSVALVPETYVAESLTESLAAHTRGKRVLLARAAVARDVIPHALRAAGATVDVVDAYRNAMPKAAPELLRQALQKGIAAVAFTSSSSVTHLAEAARLARTAFPFADIAAISIGPITSKTLRELGWEPAAEANPSDVSGLIQAIARALH